jgi:hypothetical protein
VPTIFYCNYLHRALNSLSSIKAGGHGKVLVIWSRAENDPGRMQRGRSLSSIVSGANALIVGLFLDGLFCLSFALCKLGGHPAHSLGGEIQAGGDERLDGSQNAAAVLLVLFGPGLEDVILGSSSKLDGVECVSLDRIRGGLDHGERLVNLGESHVGERVGFGDIWGDNAVRTSEIWEQWLGKADVALIGE